MISEVDKVKMELVFEQPFFASLLLRRKLIETRAIAAAGADSKGVISYNPDYFATLSRNEIKFVLAHEIMHMVCMHLWRMGTRDKKLWNQAGDYYINSFLTESRVGSMPEGGLFKEGSEKLTTEQIYDNLKGGKGPDGGEPPQGENDPLADDMDIDPKMTKDQRQEEEVKVKMEVVSAAKAAKERGRMPGALERFVNGILAVNTPWYELLARYFSSFSNQNQSWSRPNRRFIPYLPSTGKEATMGTVVVGIDTSGSIGSKELSVFGGHLNAIFEQCKPSKVVVVYCDSAVNHVDEYTKEDFPIELRPYGGGGTDMTEILSWVEENEIEPDVCCILTDGFTPFDDAPFPVVWAITTERTSPYGETVHVDLDEEK